MYYVQRRNFPTTLFSAEQMPLNTDDQDILLAFRSMDDERQKHVRIMLRALALQFPRKIGALRLVAPVVLDRFRKCTQDG